MFAASQYIFPFVPISNSSTLLIVPGMWRHWRQCRHIPGTMSKVDELLIGTKGKIYCDAANIVDSKGKVLYQYDKKQENNPYQTEHDELFATIAKGEYKFADAENGAR